MKMNFLKRVKFLQSAVLVCVIFMIIALVRISAIVPGVSQEADQKKNEAKRSTYRKEYVRGSILDRNGKVLASSEVAGGERNYSHPFAYSGLIGYYSVKYGTMGIEDTLNDILTYSKSDSDNKKGADVTLTLDSDLQEKAYDLISGFDGSAVVLDVETGEILALASSNGFDANGLEEQWKKINETEGAFLPNAFKNPVAPGSVFKIVTSKEIIEAGIDKETVMDEGSLTVGGQTIKNYDGAAYGEISYEEGLVHSSNVYFMDRALKLGASTLQKTADSFLLGQEIPLDFVTLKSTFDLGDYSENIVAATAFGQGNTLVTPLHMAMITQSIANNGKMMKPYLFKTAVNGKGKTILTGEKEELTETMEKSTAKKIRKAMTKAGEHYELSTVGDGYRIAAKTGTAQRGNGTNNAWMVTFAPADKPQYVIVLNKLKTKEIGKSLAPIAEELYEQLFHEQ